MNVMLRYPLRYLVIGIFTGFAIIIGLLTYLSTQPVVIGHIEQQASDRLQAELTQLQGVLQLLLRTGNQEGAQSVVAALGSAPAHELALLTDTTSTIVASTRLADVGAAWTTLDLELDAALTEQVSVPGSAVVRLTPDAQRLTGYVPICGVIKAATLRPRQCGFLYQRIKLSEAKTAAVAALHRQAVGYGLGLIGVAGVLGIVFHSVVTRRVEGLIAAVNRFTAGETTARAGLQGQDELAHLGDAFDSMAQTIASQQQQLQDMNRQLSYRLTERRQAEEALTMSQSHLAAAQQQLVDAIESLTEGFALYDAEDQLVLCNQNYREFYRESIDLLTPGMRFEDHIRTSAHRGQIAEAIGREEEWVRERVAQHQNPPPPVEQQLGNGRWLLVSERPTSEGGIVGVRADITDRKRSEEALNRAHAELEQRVRDRTSALEAANEEVRRFAYIVSHDLRAPLINLKGFAGELRDLCELLNTVFPELLPHLDEPQRTAVSRALTEDGPEALSFIESSVTRMDGLIRGVLDLSRAGQRKLHIEPIDMEALARHIAQTLAHQLLQTNSRMTIEPLPTLNADRIAMEQILGNLLSNAVKYLDPTRSGEISVRAERETDVTIFQVHDNGRGIAPDDIPRVFELFRRVGRQDTSGEGLGLSYVQALIRRHGGEITCQSTLGVGTTFSFTIAHQLSSGEPDAAS